MIPGEIGRHSQTAVDMRPILFVNPRHDSTFADRAENLVGDGVETPSALERALRPDYPNAIVRPRELSSEEPIWYVYRDGYWVNGREESP